MVAAQSVEFPWTEKFEFNPPSEELEGWIIVDGDGDGICWKNFIGCATVWASDDASIPPDNWMIGPAIDLPEGEQINLSWWAACSLGMHPGQYSVLLSTSGNDTSDFTTELYNGMASKSLEKFTIDLSDFGGQTVRIAFRQHTEGGGASVRIDNISIKPETRTYEFTIINDGKGPLLDDVNNFPTGESTREVDSGSVYSITAMTYVKGGYMYRENERSHTWGNVKLIRIEVDGENVELVQSDVLEIQDMTSANGVISYTLQVIADSSHNILFVFDDDFEGIDSVGADHSIHLYPNPVQVLLSVDGVEGCRRAVVSDIAGVSLLDVPLDGSAEAQLDTSQLPQGIYLLTLHMSDGTSQTTRFVKQ